MGRHRLPDPQKFCARCGAEFFRSQRPTGRWESRPEFAARKFCSLSCANSTGAAAKVTYHFRARKNLGPQCEACGSKQDTHAHHIDGDVANNAPSNIQTLCKHCHLFWHNMLKRHGRPTDRRMPRLWNS